MSNFTELTKADSAGATERSFLLRWRGKQEGPCSASVIEAKLAANEIGLLHEILDKGQWVSIRDYVAGREVAIRAEIEAKEAKKRLEQEEAARKARDQAAEREKEELLRQKLLAEAEKQFVEHESEFSEQVHKHTTNVDAPGDKRNSVALRNLGVVLLCVGAAVAAYFFLVFDTSVESGSLRVNNLGLMADRQNGILVGIGLSVVGAILLAVGYRSKN